MIKINRIQNDEGEQLEEQYKITEETTKFFMNQFKKEEDLIDFELHKDIPTSVSQD